MFTRNLLRRSSVLVVAAGMLLAVMGTATVAHAAGDHFYSSKQPYVTPDASVIAAYSDAPGGYEVTFTEGVARHGSRGLSSYKYDLLLQRLAETAAAEDGFVSDEVRDTFLANLAGMTGANVQNGYGQLTGQGETQHQGIGGRAYDRNTPLFERAVADGDTIDVESSGESRATESGENFVQGLEQRSDGALSPLVQPIEPNPDTLYFHDVENPDGTEKSGTALEIAEAYTAYVDAQTGDGGTIGAAEAYIKSLPKSEQVAKDILGGIFTEEFIAKIGTPGYTWYSTADGTKDGAVACAPGADPAADEDACGSKKNKILTPVDAALTLYNLYIIAADMAAENTAPHTFDFEPYFAGHAEDTEWFAYLLDTEDFYEKGPSLSGHDETYRIAQPLLDDFFVSIDERAAGGSNAAVYRFAHAETIIPFAALLKLPGSTQQAPDIASPTSEADVFDYGNNEWRGETVTPMAQNVQWDVATRAGVDPATGDAFTPLVRMLYNEKEIAFNDSCTPVAAGSNWYKQSELESCLSGVATTELPLIAESTPSPTTTATTPNGSPDASESTPASPATTPTAGGEQLASTGADLPTIVIVAAIGALLAGATLTASRVRSRRTWR
ncbi:histidine phosphatase family protein [Pseudoclavibacter chungangensis]|uniref:Multiple inositol polyphosphate phosphatase 1 n=1 Tax=Pseudoclavibacter chungangensis TaxID=587635 RepID=A0A7J5BNV6_9MICO|nr:histidine-type phosphatase [Pseudoclavibacter chungangensis]KAB1654087.1 histidine phosphatase family protein [Pseudoclavibacter chungangensis]NYJ65999.1 hypothetical protein [Pseudoclavibacter chungangensis]